MTGRWTLEDIPWEKFDAGKAHREIVELVKAAALVEFNGRDYEAYLANVFKEDEAFRHEVTDWAQEEVRHGEVLARWATLADPSFDFVSAVERFRAGFRIDLSTQASVRGSRAGELVARCIVETGTSSYYTALSEATDEPVLKDICRRIAADEFRHYKMFYTHLGRHLNLDKLGRWGRLRVALGRLFESTDDELAYAYYAANHADEKYDRRRFSRAYASRAYPLVARHHVERGVAMVLKAGGVNPTGRLSKFLSRLAFWFIRRQVQPLAFGKQ